jgi:DNA-binding response OmpR family regulator
MIMTKPNGSDIAMRVLMVEDDAKTAAFISRGLRQAGYTVDHAADGEAGCHLVLAEPYDIAIIDIMLPKQDGLSLIEELRRHKPSLPVITLSAKRSVDERIKGLQSGSDDYLTKPFAFAELLARMRALLRRTMQATTPTRLVVGDLSLDLLRHKATRGEKQIDLQPREFALLEYLMRHPGHVISKTMILERIWDYHFDPQTNVVEVLVSRLRSKIDQDFPTKLIHTLRGVGYVLKVP